MKKLLIYVAIVLGVMLCTLPVGIGIAYFVHESDTQGKYAEQTLQMINNICGSDWTISMSSDATTTGVFGCRGIVVPANDSSMGGVTLTTPHWNSLGSIDSRCPLSKLHPTFSFVSGIVFDCE